VRFPIEAGTVPVRLHNVKKSPRTTLPEGSQATSSLVLHGEAASHGSVLFHVDPIQQPSPQ
jgi:hypothetical protein